MSDSERREWARLAMDMREVTRRLEVSIGILTHTAEVMLYSAHEVRQHNNELKREGQLEHRKETATQS